MIKVIKFISGMEIVGQVRQKDGKPNEYIVKNAFQMVQTMQGFSMLPFLAMGDNSVEVEIKGTAIACIYDANDNFKGKYDDVLEKYNVENGKIITPKKSGIILNP